MVCFVCVVLVSGGYHMVGTGRGICHVTLNENVSAPRLAPKSSAPSQTNWVSHFIAPRLLHTYPAQDSNLIPYHFLFPAGGILVGAIVVGRARRPRTRSRERSNRDAFQFMKTLQSTAEK